MSDEDTKLNPEQKEPAGLGPSSAENDLEALTSIIAVLKPLSDEVRRRVLEAAVKFLQIDLVGPDQGNFGTLRTVTGQIHPPSRVSFSENRSMSPKDFLLEKQPKTDVERIACLAFYLTHYRDTPHFKTLDLTKLNTEAAQPKFSNAANATDNAVKRAYLVPAGKGNRQLSAAGEMFVRSLPDHDAAKSAMISLRPRRVARKKAPQVPRS